jgi:hypothetical protein
MNLNIEDQLKYKKNMLTLACVIYFFMCFISGWNLLWPLKMISSGGLGDQIIALGWIALLIAGLN